MLPDRLFVGEHDMTAPTHDGLIAGRYQLVAPIGSGGTATVYRGLDILLDREVAVKQPTLAPTADAGMHAEEVKRTFREARAAARIHHPGVAAVYDVVSGEDSPYIVMQLIKGRPLAELIAEQGPLPPHRVADIGRQVLAALVAGHVVGVLHRDLKPGNVMITPDGQAVLTDFGIAATAGDPSITRTGIVLGTPGYMAPERANGMPATPAADLWSLGATLYAALCGQGPFDDRDDALATLFAIANEDPPHLTGDGSLYEIVNALLCRDPADRPAFHEIARALDVAAADAPVTADPPSAVDLPSATGISAEPDNSPAAEAPSPVPPNFGREPDTQPDVAVAPVPAAGAPTVSSPVAEPPEAVLAEPWTAGDPSGEPWPQDAGLGGSRLGSGLRASIPGRKCRPRRGRSRSRGPPRQGQSDSGGRSWSGSRGFGRGGVRAWHQPLCADATRAGPIVTRAGAFVTRAGRPARAASGRPAIPGGRRGQRRRQSRSRRTGT